ncbi:MAG: hypothetical protein ACOYXT_02905 [Bacteroidota bacterium]
MKIKVKYVKAILNELVTRTNGSISKKGLQIIGETIGDLSENYLYTKMALAIKKRSVEEEIRYHDRSIDRILRFLRYKDLKEFIDYLENPIDKKLQKFLGSYYSYVRRSIKNEATLFRSPVSFFEENGKVWMKLKGSRLEYLGEVRRKRGVLFVSLDSSEEKSFCHIYNIGETEGPEIVQGIFAGLSNTFEPIGGRAVLIKIVEEFANLKNAELPITKLKKSKFLNERRLAEYFEKYSENNLTLNRAYSFDNRDLGNCK